MITVPSCPLHNNHTSKDDEYVRGVIVSAAGNNKLSINHWRGDVRRSFIHSPKLFFKTFKHRNGNSFFHDRSRVDSVMIKIAYALYFHIYKKVWDSNLAPFYNQFYDDDGKVDIEVRFPKYKMIPDYNVYEGANPSVFKYQYLEGRINSVQNCLFKMIFYEGFEVLIMPVKDSSQTTTLILDLKDL
ncbi:MAG: hypothetical protein ABIN95_01585 [Mucilaginibacter sp.]